MRRGGKGVPLERLFADGKFEDFGIETLGEVVGRTPQDMVIIPEAVIGVGTSEVVVLTSQCPNPIFEILSLFPNERIRTIGTISCKW